MRRAIVLSALALLIVPLASPSHAVKAAAPEGKALAQKLCSNCHMIENSQPRANADVPTFREIANRPEQTVDKTMAEIDIPQHPMPFLNLSQAELRAVASYVMSQKGK